ncbi:MAG TPA: peptidoglycan editing factor PgeF [Solirubrobacterales bacterium]|nr:peptidoglycan editing factor PgeF [Solirubrobacterales bacterium]
MRREQRGELVAYRFESLPATVEALVSTRRGGVSPPPHDSLNLGLWTADEAERVIENRRRLFAGFELPFERSVWCRQVHSDGVVVVGEADAGRGAADEASVVPDADAMVTDTPDLPLCVKVADCVPVVVLDPGRGVLGLAHAGWGGTVARICSATVRTMGERFGSSPADLLAAIGPSIGPAGYEVGADVISRARQAYGERAAEILTQRGEKALFDLWAANRIDLEEAGVAAGRIEVAGIASDERLEDFFSHRREDGRTGRFALVACLRT